MVQSVAGGGVSLAVFMSTILTLLVFILGGMFKIIRWFVNRFSSGLEKLRSELLEDFSVFRNELQDNLEELKRELACLKRDFNEFTRCLPEKYVFRESFSKDLRELKEAVSVIQRDFMILSEKIARASQRITHLEKARPRDDT